MKKSDLIEFLKEQKIETNIKQKNSMNSIEA